MPDHHCTVCGGTIEEHAGIGDQWPPACCEGCDCRATADLREALDRVLADPPVFVNGVHVGSTSSLLREEATDA